MTPMRDILVIDDEPVITRAVQKVCADEGLTVDMEEGGAAGLSRLDRGSYRLIICDLMMPGVGGLEFLDGVAAKGIRTPVIIATGYATLDNAVLSLCRGAIDFIPKPFSAEELLAAVRLALRCDALQREEASGRPAHVLCPPQYLRLGGLSWANAAGEGTVLIGAGGLLVKAIEPISRLELMRPGEEVLQGAPCAAAYSAGGDRHPVPSPVSGKIVEVNSAAAAAASVLEKHPYSEGWLYRVLPSDLQAELARLTPAR